MVSYNCALDMTLLPGCHHRRPRTAHAARFKVSLLGACRLRTISSRWGLSPRNLNCAGLGLLMCDSDETS